MTRPRPVLTATSITGVVHAIAVIVAFLGFSQVATNLNGQAQALGSVVAGAVTVGAHLVAGFTAQGHVTPTSSPHTVAGEPLVPASEVDRAYQAAKSVATVQQSIGSIESIPLAQHALISTAVDSTGSGGVDDSPIPLDPALDDTDNDDTPGADELPIGPVTAAEARNATADAGQTQPAPQHAAPDQS